MPLDQHDHRGSRSRLWLMLVIIAGMVVALPPLVIGLIMLGIGVLNFGWEGTGQLVVRGGGITIGCGIWFACLVWLYRNKVAKTAA